LLGLTEAADRDIRFAPQVDLTPEELRPDLHLALSYLRDDVPWLWAWKALFIRAEVAGIDRFDGGTKGAAKADVRDGLHVVENANGIRAGEQPRTDEDCLPSEKRNGPTGQFSIMWHEYHQGLLG